MCLCGGLGDLLNYCACLHDVNHAKLNIYRVLGLQSIIKNPRIRSTVSSKLKSLPQIGLLKEDININEEIIKGKCSTASSEFMTPPEILINRLSFSHIREIMTIDDPFERFFYEMECIKGTWSVRDLRRQISTNLFVRAGLSKKPELLLNEIQGNDDMLLTVKDPFAFEFLGLEAKDAVSESELEQALMDHLQDFLLEMGKGFCFEARQKRIIIDDE